MSLAQSKSSDRNEEKDVKERDDDEDDDVPNLKCFIMMLDLLLKQVLVSFITCSHTASPPLKTTAVFQCQSEFYFPVNLYALVLHCTLI